MMISFRNIYVALVLTATIGSFAPTTFASVAATRSRDLVSTDITVDVSEFGKPIVCTNPGEVVAQLDWQKVFLKFFAPNPQVFDLGGFLVSFSKCKSGPTAQIAGMKMLNISNMNYPTLGVWSIIEPADVIVSESAQNVPAFPTNYVTMEIEFVNHVVKGLAISIGDVDSDNMADVVRMSMSDEYGADVPLALAVNHPKIKTHEDYAWMNWVNTPVPNPGFGASLYGKPQDSSAAIKKIRLDLGLYAYKASDIGRNQTRWIYPALDFKFCADPFPTSAPTPLPTSAPTPLPTSAPTSAPVTPLPISAPVLVATPAPVPPPVSIVTVTPAPVMVATTAPVPPPVSIVTVTPAPVMVATTAPVPPPVSITTVTPAPVMVVTTAPVPPPVSIVAVTPAPVMVATMAAPVPVMPYPTTNINVPAPVPAPTDPGVNGDPIIMGLAGQIFKFEGRSGAWYSAASAKSFQWNI